MAASRSDDRRFSPLIPLAAAVLGLAAIVAGQLVPNRHLMEDDLTRRSTQALAGAGLSSVEVGFTGRDGSLKAGSEADATAALAIVRALEGVRVADAEFPLPVPAPVLTPPAVKLAITDGRITLTGVVPTEAARTAMVDAAIAQYGASNVDDRLTVDAGVTGDGLAALPAIITALGKDAKDTVVDLHGGGLTLVGTLLSKDVKDAVLAAAAGAVGTSTALEDKLVIAEVQEALIDLPPITFLDASATLTPAGRKALERAAAILAANPDVRVSIEGHTDTNGSAASNLQLSKDRAKTVVTVLRQLGVAGSRMTSTGYGETRLRVPDNSAKNQAINRRVEFIVQR